MPECNVVLLKLILCALHNIQRHSEKNKMNSYNLSLCIAPSMLWHRDHVDLSSGAPPVEFMIDHCVDIFSPSILHLLEEPKCKDYGTDSDSNHSILSMPDTGSKSCSVTKRLTKLHMINMFMTTASRFSVTKAILFLFWVPENE